MFKGLIAGYKRMRIPIYVTNEIKNKFHGLKLSEVQKVEEELTQNELNLKELEKETPTHIDFFNSNPKNDEENSQKNFSNEKKNSSSQSENSSTKFSIPVLDMRDKSHQDLLSINGDLNLGGLSQAAYQYDQNSNSVRIIGNINTDRKLKMRKIPFFEIKLELLKSINFNQANGIRLIMKNTVNPGITFKIKGSTSSMEGYSYNLGYIFENSKKWVSLDLPLQNFLVEGVDLKKKNFVDPKLMQFRAETFEFYCESQEDAQFDFNLQRIEIFYDDEIDHFMNNIKKRPYFFRSLNNYREASHYDLITGKNLFGEDDDEDDN